MSKLSLGNDQREGIRNALESLGISTNSLSDQRLADLYKRYYYSEVDWESDDSL